MKKTKLVFVLLTYRNHVDLQEFLQSAKEMIKEDYEVIVVNSFYDEDTKQNIQTIAEGEGCVFINVENKGYGYGNNVGIEYAMNHYDYEYVIVSNPDILIKKYSATALNGYEKALVAPKIINKKGKMQNPMIWKKSPVADWLIYKGLKDNSKLFFVMGLAINKLIRSIYIVSHPKDSIATRIYQAHGSFMIFSKYVLDTVGKPFDENIFLFAEEGDLAALLEKNGIETYYVPGIQVYHKEDGSMQFRDDLDSRLVDANVYVYEKHHKKDR